MRRFAILLCFAAVLRAEIPQTVAAESNLEKRSELALKEADERIGTATKVYADADPAAFASHLKSIEELSRYSLKSLQDTGKRASRSPKYFKRAELKLRTMLRRLASLENEVSGDDRARVEQVTKTLTEVHDQILQDIMSKK